MLGSGFKLVGSAGLNLKWHLANDVTLDAAFNPDFAQVEADQVILNLTNFETFLPEKRPFFLEGIDAFSFPLQVFYSRRIGARADRADGGHDAARWPTSRRPPPSTAPASWSGASGPAGRWARSAPSPPRTASPSSTRRWRHVVERARRADDRVQRPAPQARAGRRRPPRHHRHRTVRDDDFRRLRSAFPRRVPRAALDGALALARRRITSSAAPSSSRTSAAAAGRTRHMQPDGTMHRRRRDRARRLAARRQGGRQAPARGAPSTPAPAARSSTTTSATWRGRTCTC